MSDVRDFYQRLVSIPNLLKDFKGEKEVRRVLLEMKNLLESIQVKIDGAEEYFEARGRKDYASAIKARCDHLHKRARNILDHELSPHFSDALLVPDTDEVNNSLRDLYHYLYYTLFYLGRYVLVSGKEMDNGHHSEMTKALTKYMKGRSGAPGLDLADLLIARLQEFSNKRDDADYKINGTAIKNLENIDSIKRDCEIVKDLWELSNRI